MYVNNDYFDVYVQLFDLQVFQCVSVYILCKKLMLKIK